MKKIKLFVASYITKIAVIFLNLAMKSKAKK
jgi:hypothetical protein